MHKALTLLAAGAAILAVPALAQVGGTVGGSVDTTVDTGPVAGTVGNVTGQVGKTVEHVDGAVNGAIDSTKLVVATREQVRAGAQIVEERVIGAARGDHDHRIAADLRAGVGIAAIGLDRARNQGGDAGVQDNLDACRDKAAVDGSVKVVLSLP